ncbi:MAG: hypothetical protein J1F32_01995 [Erysipelotrichales bacterium]|nr:hypothetical protein [Erysipelotrichales bacterium]
MQGLTIKEIKEKGLKEYYKLVFATYEECLTDFETVGRFETMEEAKQAWKKRF